MVSQWVVFGSFTMLAIAIGILFVCTNLCWEFWDDLDEEEERDLRRFLRDNNESH